MSGGWEGSLCCVVSSALMVSWIRDPTPAGCERSAVQEPVSQDSLAVAGETDGRGAPGPSPL